MALNNIYLPVPVSMSDWYPWCQLLARAVNGILGGGQNVTNTITLTANAATTTLTDSRIGAFSFISLSPTTANAAGENWWIAGQLKGSATIHHANAATTDRIFNVLIVA